MTVDTDFLAYKSNIFEENWIRSLHTLGTICHDVQHMQQGHLQHATLFLDSENMLTTLCYVLIGWIYDIIDYVLAVIPSIIMCCCWRISCPHKCHLCNTMMNVCCVRVHASLPTYMQRSPSSISHYEGHISNCHHLEILQLSKVDCLPDPAVVTVWSTLLQCVLLLRVCLAHVEPVSASPASSTIVSATITIIMHMYYLRTRPHPQNSSILTSVPS